MELDVRGKRVVVAGGSRGIGRSIARASIPHRVNCVAPGSIEFPGGSWEERKGTDPALYNQVLKSMPAGRLGKPEEVASVVLFLASALASWVTAQVIGVNGGQGFAK